MTDVIETGVPVSEKQAVPTTFGARLTAAVDQHGPLCVGIDPHRELLEQWGLTDDAAGLKQFGEIAVEALGGHVALVKPQSAFFERHGSAGVAVLEDVLSGLAAAGTLTLLDAKRGDIGSTMAAYAEAYLSDTSPIRADAMTASPYLGFESLDPALDLAKQTGRGVFVLALTSNPEGAAVQRAVLEDRTVAAAMIAGAAARNADETSRLGSTGLVVGATVGSTLADLGLYDALLASRAPLLAPGLGAQGADAAALQAAFGPVLSQVVPASSRDVLRAGPDVEALRAAARRTAESLAAVYST